MQKEPRPQHLINSAEALSWKESFMEGFGSFSLAITPPSESWMDILAPKKEINALACDQLNISHDFINAFLVFYSEVENSHDDQLSLDLHAPKNDGAESHVK